MAAGHGSGRYDSGNRNSRGRGIEIRMDTIETRGLAVAQELIGLGVTAPFAAAMAGNAMLESGARTINPSKDGSDGLFQWRNAPGVARLTALKNFSAHSSLDWTSLNAQCQFAIHECQADFPQLWALQNTGRSVATLTMDWCDIYERPAVSGRVPDIRIKYATEVFAALGVREVQAQSAPSTGAMTMPAILLTDVLPIIAPFVGKMLLLIIKDLETANPGLSGSLKQIFDDVAKGL